MRGRDAPWQPRLGLRPAVLGAPSSVRFGTRLAVTRLNVAVTWHAGLIFLLALSRDGVSISVKNRWALDLWPGRRKGFRPFFIFSF